MHFAVAESERNPTLEFESAKEACECEARGDWIGAEAAYRKRQALQEATVNFGLIWKAHRDLSQLFLLIGDLDQADQVGNMATEAARRTDLFPLKVMALEDHARRALRRGDHAGALKAASEAVDHVEAGSVYDQMRAGALALRARCRIAAGDVEGAEQDLAASKPILLDRETSPIFAGAHGKASFGGKRRPPSARSGETARGRPRLGQTRLTAGATSVLCNRWRVLTPWQRFPEPCGIGARHSQPLASLPRQGRCSLNRRTSGVNSGCRNRLTADPRGS